MLFEKKKKYGSYKNTDGFINFVCDINPKLQTVTFVYTSHKIKFLNR